MEVMKCIVQYDWVGVTGLADRVRMNHTTLKEILGDLVRVGLVKKEWKSNLHPKYEGGYVLTDRGLKALRKYEIMLSMLGGGDSL